MSNFLANRFSKSIFAWITLFTYLLLAIVVVLAIETLIRDYPEFHWWNTDVPVNVFSDAFIPALNNVLFILRIPLAFVSLLPVLFFSINIKRILRWVEIVCYFLSIIILWAGFWIVGFEAECQVLGLQSDGGPWGPCMHLFHRPFIYFNWHILIWILWSVALIWLWTWLKNILHSDRELDTYK